MPTMRCDPMRECSTAAMRLASSHKLAPSLFLATASVTESGLRRPALQAVLALYVDRHDEGVLWNGATSSVTEPAPGLRRPVLQTDLDAFVAQATSGWL